MARVPDPEHAPAVPAAVRSTAYFVALVVGAAYAPLVGVAPVVGWDTQATAAVAGAAAAFVGTVAGGLGVAYRPKPAPAATPARLDGEGR